MINNEELIAALVTVSSRWQDPDYHARAEATGRTVDLNGWFTEEAIVFAVNQQLSQVTTDLLRGWIDRGSAAVPLSVGVICAGNVPFADFQDFLSVLLAGHRYIGKVSSQSPFLLPAFVADLLAELPSVESAFVDLDTVFGQADLIIASGSDTAINQIAVRCDGAGIGAESRLLRGHGFGVGVVGGNESAAERSGLAEDLLLHEGRGCRSLALLWAPKGLNPDPYLDFMAQVRGVFPPSPKVYGSLKMQEAFLAATSQSHAVGPGFLVSKGPAEAQSPGHIRWVEYDNLEAVSNWLDSGSAPVQVVVASDKIRPHLPASQYVVTPGDAQRPALDWQSGGVDTIEFLRNGGNGNSGS